MLEISTFTTLKDRCLDSFDLQGHHEHPPFDNNTLRSAYHIRELDVFRLKQLQSPLDIFLSHDWPRGIAKHGNLPQLLSRKAFLRAEVR